MNHREPKRLLTTTGYHRCVYGLTFDLRDPHPCLPSDRPGRLFIDGERGAGPRAPNAEQGVTGGCQRRPRQTPPLGNPVAARLRELQGSSFAGRQSDHPLLLWRLVYLACASVRPFCRSGHISRPLVNNGNNEAKDNLAGAETAEANRRPCEQKVNQQARWTEFLRAWRGGKVSRKSRNSLVRSSLR